MTLSSPTTKPANILRRARPMHRQGTDDLDFLEGGISLTLADFVRAVERGAGEFVGGVAGDRLRDVAARLNWNTNGWCR